jgi:hypothetical protein
MSSDSVKDAISGGNARPAFAGMCAHQMAHFEGGPGPRHA